MINLHQVLFFVKQTVKMRFFIALEIPPQDRAQLNLIQEQLKQAFPEIRLTEQDKLHLTIAFIGEQDKNLITPISKIIKDAVKTLKPFAITPAYIDGFPHLHNARVIWVGVKGEIDKLYLLRHLIKDGLESLGLPVDERRYTPHIAIAKTSKFFIPKEKEYLLQKVMEKPLNPITVDSVKLFESIPNHGFHQHNTLAEVKLG